MVPLLTSSVDRLEGCEFDRRGGRFSASRAEETVFPPLISNELLPTVSDLVWEEKIRGNLNAVIHLRGLSTIPFN
jgi:hypothetical protein